MWAALTCTVMKSGKSEFTDDYICERRIGSHLTFLPPAGPPSTIPALLPWGSCRTPGDPLPPCQGPCLNSSSPGAALSLLPWPPALAHTGSALELPILESNRREMTKTFCSPYTLAKQPEGVSLVLQPLILGVSLGAVSSVHTWISKMR